MYVHSISSYFSSIYTSTDDILMFFDVRFVPLQRHKVAKHGHSVDECRQGNPPAISGNEARGMDGIVDEGGPSMTHILMNPGSPKEKSS